MRKHLIVALASVVIATFCGGAVAAQQPGSRKGTKSKKPKTKPAEATQPAPPGKVQPAAPSPQTPAKDGATGFKEVTKEKFKEVYFRLGGGKRTGWTADYWQKLFEEGARPGWKFMVEEPRSPKHVRMFIVTDTKAKEYRLYFLTEESEEDSEWPGR